MPGPFPYVTATIGGQTVRFEITRRLATLDERFVLAWLGSPANVLRLLQSTEPDDPPWPGSQFQPSSCRPHRPYVDAVIALGYGSPNDSQANLPVTASMTPTGGTRRGLAAKILDAYCNGVESPAYP